MDYVHLERAPASMTGGRRQRYAPPRPVQCCAVHASGRRTPAAARRAHAAGRAQPTTGSVCSRILARSWSPFRSQPRTASAVMSSLDSAVSGLSPTTCNNWAGQSRNTSASQPLVIPPGNCGRLVRTGQRAYDRPQLLLRCATVTAATRRKPRPEPCRGIRSRTHLSEGWAPPRRGPPEFTILISVRLTRHGDRTLVRGGRGHPCSSWRSGSACRCAPGR